LLPPADRSYWRGATRVIARFVARIVLLCAFAAFGSVGFGRSLAALLWMPIIPCAVVGLLRREPLFGTTLNHWDEGAAFGALFALVHIVKEASSGLSAL
jgi:hypothetical protein